MTSLAKRFFATGAVFVTLGMLLGIHMAASQDHILAPAHAHLNLIGFVTMSIYGTFYALAPAAQAGKLPQIHYWVSVIGILIGIPGIAIAVTGGGEALAIIGSFLFLASMLIFLTVVLRTKTTA